MLRTQQCYWKRKNNTLFYLKFEKKKFLIHYVYKNPLVIHNFCKTCKYQTKIPQIYTSIK